jgi:hypothetical protein
VPQWEKQWKNFLQPENPANIYLSGQTHLIINCSTFMKLLSITFLSVILICVGCVSTPSNQALEARLIKRLSDVDAFRETKGQIKEVRFSKDHTSVLVFVDLPPDSKLSSELILKDDGFQRYHGQWWGRRAERGEQTVPGMTRLPGGVAEFAGIIPIIPITVDMGSK